MLCMGHSVAEIDRANVLFDTAFSITVGATSVGLAYSAPGSATGLHCMEAHGLGFSVLVCAFSACSRLEPMALWHAL